jgi:hypothetical protein
MDEIKVCEMPSKVLDWWNSHSKTVSLSLKYIGTYNSITEIEVLKSFGGYTRIITVRCENSYSAFEDTNEWYWKEFVDIKKTQPFYTGLNKMFADIWDGLDG